MDMQMMEEVPNCFIMGNTLENGAMYNFSYYAMNLQFYQFQQSSLTLKTIPIEPECIINRN
jgi:hypothetical protein